MELQQCFNLNDLYHSVVQNDEDKIREILSKNRELLHQVKPDYGCPIISIACYIKEIKARTLQVLLELGANCSDSNGDEGWRPIHYAASEQNLPALKTLVRFSNNCLNDRDQYGNNALHFLLRSKEDKASSDFFECADFLIGSGIDVHQKNAKNLSPLDQFFRNKDTESQMAIQDILSKYGKSLVTDEPEDKLLEYINKEDDAKVLQELKKLPHENLHGEYRTHGLTLLELCCKHRLENAVIYLLQQGVSPNDFKDVDAPIIEVAERGLTVIFKILLNAYKLEDIPCKLLLKILLNIDGGPSYCWCYRALIDKLKDYNEPSAEVTRLKLINFTDKMKNTPLMYALCFANSEVVQELLSLGAYLGSRNKLGNAPIKRIEPKDLETHLDNSVILHQGCNRFEENFKIKFKFDSLVPSKCSSSDTEVVLAMTESRGLKDLLAHPVVVSFLTLKWRQYQMIFYVNFAAFILFFLCYSAFIAVDYQSYMKPPSSQEGLRNAFKWILFSLILMLTIRELFQLYVNRLDYFKHLDNYVEWTLIIVAYLTIFLTKNKRELWAVSVLLLSFALVLQLGKHPFFSTSIVMLRTVTFNFFKSFLAYCVLIFAFAVSFYILFTDNIKEGTSEENNMNDETFKSFGGGMFKTLVMLTGEFDSGSLTFPGLFVSRFIFIFFILIVHLVLLNLLNGLAVSDTQVIRGDAELFGHIARVRYIRLVENILSAEGGLGKLGLKYKWYTLMFKSIKDIEKGDSTQGKFEVDFYPNKNKFCQESHFYKLLKNSKLNDDTLHKLQKIIQKKVKKDTEQTQTT